MNMPRRQIVVRFKSVMGGNLLSESVINANEIALGIV